MRRPGITLMEVLAAIFITGIGLLSLLVLFPVGALSMARAIQDDRAAQAGENGRAIANAVGIRFDGQVQQAALNLNLAFANNQSPAMADGAGYLVLNDPIGVLAYTGQVTPTTNWPAWVGGYLPTVNPPLVPSNIQRVQGNWLLPANGVNLTTADYLRWCSLLDDIGFVGDGTYQGLASNPPAYINPGAASVLRNLKYSYAWFCRMPRAGSPNVVDVSTLVFTNRSPDSAGFGAQGQESVYNATFAPTQNQVTITLQPGQTNPDLRAGQWILDATTTYNAGTGQLSVAGFFYRVVTVVEDPNTGQMTLEVQTPLRGWTNPGMGTIVIFANLLEVFDSGTF